MMVTPLALSVARFHPLVAACDLLVQLFPANPHFLLRDGVQDPTAKIEPFASEILRVAIPVNEGMVQAHESLCSLKLIESPGSRMPSGDGSNTHIALPMAQARPLAQGGGMVEAARENRCSLLHTFVFAPGCCEVVDRRRVLFSRQLYGDVCAVAPQKGETCAGMWLWLTSLGECFW